MSTHSPGPWWRRLSFLNSKITELKKAEAGESNDFSESPKRRSFPAPQVDQNSTKWLGPGAPKAIQGGAEADRTSSSNASEVHDTDCRDVSTELRDTEPRDLPSTRLTSAPTQTSAALPSSEPVSHESEPTSVAAAKESPRALLDSAREQLAASTRQINELREQLRRSKERESDAIARAAQSKQALTDRTLRHKAQNEKLKASILELRSKTAAANERNVQTRQLMIERQERSSAQVAKLKESLQEQRSRTTRANERVLEARKLMAERTALLKGRLAESREKLLLKNDLYNAARRYYAVYRQGLLLDEALKAEVDFSADAYLCLLPSTVPAGMTLSRVYGGRVYCDCVENVEVHKHSLAPNVHKPTLEMINLSAFGSLMSVDGIMTVGNALARTLERFGTPVHVAPNYRRYEEPIPAGELREACGLGADEKLLFASGNVVVGFEPVIRALAQLPDDVHLAAFIKLKPVEYESEMITLIDELGLSHRIHFFDFVPYEKLASIAADADIGLITSDVTNPNGAVALPNRLFDYVTAGLPVIAPPMPDVVDIVQAHKFGITLESVTAENWESAIREVLINLDSYRSATVDARNVLSWENGEDEIVRFLGNPTSVTLLGFRDLSRYQRFLRVTQALTSRGIKVKALFLSDNPAPVPFEGSEFYSFSDRYGLGDGPTRVPTGKA